MIDSPVYSTNAADQSVHSVPTSWDGMNSLIPQRTPHKKRGTSGTVWWASQRTGAEMGNPIRFAPGTGVVAANCSLARSPRQIELILAWAFVAIMTIVHARPPASTPAKCAGRTQAVETVEKVPFQKMNFEKWDRNTEKHQVFCVLSNILAIFEPVVGDFYEHFSSQGFFDSLVGPHSPEIASRWLGANIS